MADVDMTDAPSTSGAATKKDRKGGDVEAKGDGKKRFEVKKASGNQGWRKRAASSERGVKEITTYWPKSKPIVECRCAMGLGYRCRQLRYLP